MSAVQSIDSPSNGPPPDITERHPRLRRAINAGLVVSNDMGRRWWKDKYGSELSDDHWEDFNVPLRLGQILREHGICEGCIFAPRRPDPQQSGPYMSDFLVITQYFIGVWTNEGPDDYEEVLMEGVKPVETEVEERVKKWLKEELGKWQPLDKLILD